MEAFLERIANHVSKENLPYLYSSCYIFPTKRAALYFSDYLQKKFPEENFILPETHTIQEFITQFSSLTIKDDWDILFDTYLIQHELTGIEQPLDKFIPWGKMILKDFDECDKYLVNVEQLFSLLSTQKKIDDSFVLSEETKRYIEQFILTASTKENKKENKLRSEFVKTWSQLGDIYAKLQERLLKEQSAYEGMAYKEVLDKLQSGKLQLPYQKIAFCGFNALSVCEEKIFEAIAQAYETAFWWDADSQFMDNTFHEAGNFLRNYKTKFSGENSHWVMDSSPVNEKKINIAGISSSIGQAEFIANELENKQEGTTAVVLCDEYLLSPLLYSIKDEDYNITMGYAASQSEVYLFTNLLLSLYGNAIDKGEKYVYYHKDIKALCDHVYLKNSNLHGKGFREDIALHIPYMPEETLANYLPKNILGVPKDAVKILRKVSSILNDLKETDNYFFSVRNVISLELDRLAQTLEEKGIQLQQRSLSFIVKQFLSPLKVPFETNKESKVQIMGFLETRILDFENLYIISLNDNNLPGTNKTNSFIPYNLRKGFGLPTFEQFDGVNAYHFYRLLKRAKNIHLLYNNQLGDNASEKSRFIRQLEHEYTKTDEIISEYIVDIEDPEIVEQPTTLLNVVKTADMTEHLRKKRFSASSLKIYIQCPLQFYLKYVAGIKEPNELTEEIDAAIFGNLLHKVLELTYKPYQDSLLGADQIVQLADNKALHKVILEACLDKEIPKAITQDSNQLQLKIIEQIAQKIILNDAATAPLQVIHTETEFNWDKLILQDGSTVSIFGTIDRVDKISEHAIRIIDYKTGKIELPKSNLDTMEGIETFLDILFSYKDKDYSAVFQGIFYALIYYKLHDCREIYVGYHHAKKMKSGITYLNQQQPIPIKLLERFEEKLSELISNIIYKEPYFTQSENNAAYKYSPYANLLGLDV